jgi:Tol biopolymer transport system component
MRTRVSRVVSDTGVLYVPGPGGRFLVQRSQPDFRIAVVDETGASFDLTAGGREFAPAWSSDGESIAFQVTDGSRSFQKGIWVMSRDARDKRRVAKEGFLPAWFPDASGVLYCAQVNEGAVQICAVKPDGTSRRVLGAGTAYAIADAAPLIAFRERDELWVMRFDGTEKKRLMMSVSSFGWVRGAPLILAVSERWSEGSLAGTDINLVDPAEGTVSSLAGGLGFVSSPAAVKVAESVSAAAPVPSPDRQPEGQPEKQPETQPEKQPDKQPEKQPDKQPEKQQGRQPEAQPEKKADKKNETLPQSQPEKKPEAQPEKQPDKQPEKQAVKQADKRSAGPSKEPAKKRPVQQKKRPASQPRKKVAFVRPRPLPLQCIIDTKKVSVFTEPCWSPDGKAIVFLYVIPPAEEEGGRAGIAQVNADGSDYRSLVCVRAQEAGGRVIPAGLSVSPDGRRMLFMQDTKIPGRETQQALYVLETETQSLIPMDPYYILKMKGPLPVRFSRGSWNRKDGTICFGAVNPPSISVKDERLCGIWVARANASYASAILKDRRRDFSLSNPSWSPSGQALAFWRHGQEGFTLVFWKRGDERLRKIVTLKKPVPYWWRTDSGEVAWLDRGVLRSYYLSLGRASVLYERVSSPCALAGDFLRVAYARGGTVYVQGAARVEKVLYSPGRDVTGLSWSPDGRHLAVTAEGSLWIVREKKIMPLISAAQ